MSDSDLLKGALTDANLKKSAAASAAVPTKKPAEVPIIGPGCAGTFITPFCNPPGPPVKKPPVKPPAKKKPPTKKPPTKKPPTKKKPATKAPATRRTATKRTAKRPAKKK